MEILAILIITVVIYFFPAIVAVQRGHNNKAAILILNLFLGWTFLGWVVALIWSFTDNVFRDETVIHEHHYNEPEHGEKDIVRKEPRFREPFDRDS